MMINVRVVSPLSQRYNTVGDWWFESITDDDDTILQVRVSNLGDWRFETLVAHHEITEALLCYNDNVTDDQVTKFDTLYENAREAGDFAPCGCKPTQTSEPGDDPHSPYYKQHQIATSFERAMAAQMDVPWTVYEEACLGV